MARFGGLQWLALALYVAVVGAMIAFHEPWRDEAQTWLVARDLSVSELLAHLRHDKTPGLWHGLIAPFARLEFPYITQQIVHTIVAIAAIALMFTVSPFAPWQKAVLALSYYPVYEYAVIARNYNLSMLLLFALAWAYPHRLRRPVAYGTGVALLANANVHSFVLAGVLAGVWAIELWSRRVRRWSRWTLLGASVMGAGLVVSYAQFRPTPEVAHLYEGLHWSAPWIGLRSAYFPNMPAYLPEPALIVAAAAIWLTILWSLRRHGDLLALFAVPTLTWMYLHVTNHPGAYRHWGFVLLLSVFCLWLLLQRRAVQARASPVVGERTHTSSMQRGAPSRAWAAACAGGPGVMALSVALLLSVGAGYRALKADVQMPFCASRDMAMYLREHGGDRPIATYRSTRGMAVLPYLPGRTLWRLDTMDEGTFITIDQRFLANQGLEPEQVLARARARFADRRVWLLLEFWPEHVESLGLCLVHRSEGMNSNLFLYEWCDAKRQSAIPSDPSTRQPLDR